MVDNEFVVHEHFMGFYLTENTLSATLFQSLMDVPARFDIVDYAKRNNANLSDFQCVMKFLKEIASQLIPMIPEYVQLVKIILCMPVSTCSAERSFSGLRWLKTYLRSTTTQERLNFLAIISCHSSVVDQLNFDDLMDEFIKKTTVRMNTFALSR